MKILIAPDKFKGSLTANEVCLALQEGLMISDNSLDINLCPMADGGDGSLEVLRDHKDITRKKHVVKDPLMRDIESYYYHDNNTAYIEMANASGLVLLDDSERNCMNTTSYGTGQLVLEAISKGFKEIYLFVGGSATNDGGIGVLSALGHRFYNKNKKLLEPIGSNLIYIDFIDSSNAINTDSVDIYVVCDVKNLMTGMTGASYSFAKQKGANEEERKALELGMIHFTQYFSNTSIAITPGSGAAGGIAGGLMAFIDAQLVSGIDFFLKTTNFKLKITDVDLVITGEGSIDDTSLQGKTISGVCAIVSSQKTPIIGVCGVYTGDKIDQLGIENIYSIMDISETKEEAIQEAYSKLVNIGNQIGEKYC